MKKLLYTGLATLVFIPCLSFTHAESKVNASEIKKSQEVSAPIHQDNLGTFTHEGTTYNYAIIEDSTQREVTISNGKSSETAKYDKASDKIYLNDKEIKSELKTLVKDITQDQKLPGEISTMGYGDIPSGYKYVKGSTIDGSFGFVNAGVLSILAVLGAAAAFKNFKMASLVGIASAIVGSINSTIFTIYWTRKTYKKKQGKYKRTGWQLRIYRDSNFKKLIHKEWSSIGDGAIR